MIGQIFNTIFAYPITNILIALYKFFLLLRIPGAFGLAIIALTVLVRLLLHPFFQKQLETTKKMNDIKPHLDRLSSQHKNDKKKLQEEQMKLYQQAGINPASGCLFMIIQMPIFIALYNTLSTMLTNKGGAAIAQINKVLYAPFLHIQTIDPWFFGINVAKTPSDAGSYFYYIIPVITGILQYMQVAAITPAPAEKPKDTKEITKPGAEKKEGSGDFQKAMNTQMKFIFPVMIGWFSLQMPIGLSLYWNIFSIFSILQYRGMKKKEKSNHNL